MFAFFPGKREIAAFPTRGEIVTAAKVLRSSGLLEWKFQSFILELIFLISVYPEE